jgi:hypothetical protein
VVLLRGRRVKTFFKGQRDRRFQKDSDVSEVYTCGGLAGQKYNCEICTSISGVSQNYRAVEEYRKSRGLLTPSWEKTFSKKKERGQFENG